MARGCLLVHKTSAHVLVLELGQTCGEKATHTSTCAHMYAHTCRGWWWWWWWRWRRRWWLCSWWWRWWCVCPCGGCVLGGGGGGRVFVCVCACVCVCVFVRLIYTYAHTHARLLARITCVVHFGLKALCCDLLRVLSLRDRSTTAPCRQTVGHVHPLEQSFPQEASEYWFQNIPIGFTHRRNAGSAQSTTPYVRRRKYRETTLAALRVAAPSARPCWRLQ